MARSSGSSRYLMKNVQTESLDKVATAQKVETLFKLIQSTGQKALESQKDARMSKPTKLAAVDLKPTALKKGVRQSSSRVGGGVSLAPEQCADNQSTTEAPGTMEALAFDQ